MAVLYSAFSPELAIRESNQVGNLQPTILVAYDAEIIGLFDARDPSELHRRITTLEEIARSDWRLASLSSAGQKLARELYEFGFPVFIENGGTNGAQATDFNIVLWGRDTRKLGGKRLGTSLVDGTADFIVNAPTTRS